MAAAVETVRLSKSYGATRAVSNLDLVVDAGQVFAFLGPNGAGKSTTIRLLLGLQRPTSGTAWIFGLDPHRDAGGVHARVGYLPGELELYPRLTGQRLITWFARARGCAHDGYIAELVERFDVVVDRPARELSKGNRQKIGLVIAFMHQPELVILDEPTAGLDPLMRTEFEQLIRETVAQGRTVFLSSHELDEVQRIADRIAIIKDGELVATDTIAGLAESLPRHIEARFGSPVEPAAFSALDGVRVTACSDTRLSLDVSGPLAPLLRLIAEREPLDLVSRPARLDELFLNFYRGQDARDTR